MTLNSYLTDVDRALAAHGVPDRSAILTELRDSAEAVWQVAGYDGVVHAFGTPDAFARDASSLAPERASDGALWHILGVPMDVRGPVSARARSRIWDTRNPHIFVPHLLGMGWSINLGAVAVRLGLVRPDDDDDDLFATIPQHIYTAARLLPILPLSVAAVTAAMHWHLLTANQATARSVAKGLGAAVLAAAWSASSREPTEDSLIRASLATTLSTVTGSLVLVRVLGSEMLAENNSLRLGILVGSLGIGMATIVVPIRIGLKRIWQSEGIRS